MSVCLSIYVSVCMSVCLPACLFVSVCQYIYFPFKSNVYITSNLTQQDHYRFEAYKITLHQLHFNILISLALQRCIVTEIIDRHLVLKLISFRLPSSFLALLASLFKYLTACSPQWPKCLKTRGMTNGQDLSDRSSELYFASFFSSRFIAATPSSLEAAFTESKYHA